MIPMSVRRRQAAWYGSLLRFAEKRFSPLAVGFVKFQQDRGETFDIGHVFVRCAELVGVERSDQGGELLALFRFDNKAVVLCFLFVPLSLDRRQFFNQRRIFFRGRGCFPGTLVFTPKLFVNPGCEAIRPRFRYGVLFHTVYSFVGFRVCCDRV